MSKQPRGEFSTRIGFILAATGSAVGLGNVWGFPTNAAANGGAAFVLVYLLLAFCLAYPALMAELIIGRYHQSNIVSALAALSPNPAVRKFGVTAGVIGVITASAILGFYALVAGWMLAQFGAYGAEILRADTLVNWLGESSVTRDIFCAFLFSVLTMSVVSAGVHKGIERWSDRLMPSLLILLALLIVYVLLQPGAAAGLKLYLVPDFSRVFHPQLVISALGQAFFSLSLGVGTMLIYGSYVSRRENLPALGAIVTLVDVAVAFCAGLLILPAMFVAQNHGIEIYQDGQLIAGPDLIFQVLPALFDSMGAAGLYFAVLFFALMSIAALTSSISMLEVPTSVLVESTPLQRRAAAALASTLVFTLTAAIVVWFDPLFGWVVNATTQFSEPLVGIILCLYAGWGIQRNKLLQELSAGNPEIASTLFWKVWPIYVRFFCPLLIALAFIQSFIN